MNAGLTTTRGVLSGPTPTQMETNPSPLKSECLIRPQKDQPLVLNQHLCLGRVNEPRDAKESRLHPEGTGDLELLQAQEVTWSDSHFGKVSVSELGGSLDCRCRKACCG